MTRTTNDKPRTLARGVWIAPWLGRNGEALIIATDRHGRFVADVQIPVNASMAVRLFHGDALWDLLDKLDPQPTLEIG